MSILKQLHKAQHHALKYQHGDSEIHVKIKAVCSADLMSHGVATLLTMPGLVEAMQGASAAKASDMQVLASKLAAAGPNAMRKLATGRDALCCAGVVAISENGEQWEPCQLVMPDVPESPDQAMPRLHVTILPYNIRQQLARDIEQHSTGGKAAQAALAEFRKQPSDAGHHGNGDEAHQPDTNADPAPASFRVVNAAGAGAAS